MDDWDDLDHAESNHKDRKPAPRPRSPLRQLVYGMVVFCIIGIVFAVVMQRFVPRPPSPPPRSAAAMTAPQPPNSRPTQPSLTRSVSYRADGSGHYYVDAVVNGVPIHFLVDTGASYVALTPQDALAAGFTQNSLRFSQPLNTANGVTNAARVTLREVRLQQQLALDDVAAVVMKEPGSVSLLGMSFLSRLEGYSIRDGILTIEW